MKVITEERLREWQNTNGVYKELFQKLIEECQELDTLTGANEPDLILAAEKYSENYGGDERQDIKTDVLNAYYQGAYWNKKLEKK